MTVLRSESRATLKWCLKQSGQFTQGEAIDGLHILQMTASRQFRAFEGLGLIRRTKITGSRNAYTFHLIDRELAEKLANEKPKPRNGYTPVAQRPVRRMVNSVFQLGAM